MSLLLNNILIICNDHLLYVFFENESYLLIIQDCIVRKAQPQFVQN